MTAGGAEGEEGAALLPEPGPGAAVASRAGIPVKGREESPKKGKPVPKRQNKSRGDEFEDFFFWK